MKTFENRLIRDALERRTETKRKDPLFNQSMLAHAQRGFCGVGLEGRQTTANLGSVMRAAACFGSNFVAVHPGRLRHSRTDTQKGFRHIPLFQAEDLLALVPFGCEAVGVEVSDRAEDLTTFEHPQQAFYLFGPEGGSLSERVQDQCSRIVQMPTADCLNLSMAVNVLLYDRLLKNMRR